MIVSDWLFLAGKKKKIHIMLIRFDDKEKQGTRFQEIEAFQGRREIVTSQAVVLTGAGGTGKTTLLDALAYSGGLGDRYSSSATTYRYSNLEMNDLSKTHAGAWFADDEKVEFDRVLRFRGDEVKARPLAMDTMEDMQLMFSNRGSHGQVNINRLGALLQQSGEYLKDEKGKLLVVLDEPEAGLGMDVIFRLTDHLSLLCRKAVRSKRLWTVIATQCPFFVMVCQDAGATRLDLGGWRWGDPMELFSGGLTNQLIDKMRPGWKEDEKK
jgi:predicted ATPase